MFEIYVSSACGMDFGRKRGWGTEWKNGILHVDMNNFYASVETLYAPEYRNVPMAVAGG